MHPAQPAVLEPTPAAPRPTSLGIAGLLVRHRWFLGWALVALLVFGWLVTQGEGRLLAADDFGAF